jgi:hypothetical protein
MNTITLKLVTCVLWSGVALSGATPARALMFSTQSGSFALCSNSYMAIDAQHCDLGFGYVQGIKLATVACNSGGTCRDAIVANGVDVEFVYSLGRKRVMPVEGCAEGNLYDLSYCPC